MGKVQNVTYIEFKDILENEKKPIIVDTWAPWCGPCKSIEPYFELLFEKYKNQMRFLRMNGVDPVSMLATLSISPHKGRLS